MKIGKEMNRPQGRELVRTARTNFERIQKGGLIPFNLMSPLLKQAMRNEAASLFGGENPEFKIYKFPGMIPDWTPVIVKTILEANKQAIINRKNAPGIDQRMEPVILERRLGKDHILMVTASEAGDGEWINFIGAVLPPEVLAKEEPGDTSRFRGMDTLLLREWGAHVIFTY